MRVRGALTLVAFTLSPGGAAPARGQESTPLQVLRIVAGPAGSEANGTFVLTEERSAFSRSDDREAIVLFEWQGTPGAHKLVAHWRSPDGGLTSTSSIDYTAKDRRFGGYWRLTLSPSMPLGTWSIEATVDGQPGGRFTFEITDTKVSAPEVKRPLTQAELYERLNRAFVVLQRSSARGRELDSAAGFVVSGGRIYTSMAAVDDADRIRALTADGAALPVTMLQAWNRRQDWAVILAGPGSAETLPVAAAGATKVGDRCFSMDGTAGGGRVLVEGTISGQTVGSPAAFLIAAFLNGIGTPGAPVLNEFGELIGLVGGAAVPGATRMIDIVRFRAEFKGAPIVPFPSIRVRPDIPGSSLNDLRARGELIAALAGDEHVLSGGFARTINRGPVVAPADQREDFSAREPKFVVFITWNPRDRLRGETMLRLFDTSNRIVLESKPKKSDFRKDRLALSSWDVPMLSAPGLYRAEVLFANQPVWRGFIRITP